MTPSLPLDWRLHLREQLASEARGFIETAKGKLGAERVYGFVFEVAVEGNAVYAAVATEEGLDRVVAHYAELGYRSSERDSLGKLRTWLRWAGPEDGWFRGVEEGWFNGTAAVLNAAFSAGQLELYDGQLLAAALDALRALDVQGEFGSGVERERVVIGITYVGGNNSTAEFLGWAEQVNPTSVVTRLRCEVEAGLAAGERIARE